ncbi:hypothetical protein SAMN04489712_12145 [Thermomonospora echinospora]|uniref:DUF6603 domain-containing protein n=1 Tax=Thermomonospora echinospora TaxID=1992 RepID=A0A1H6DRN0_9ACTN|nr:DUF6603 domain-containing protein [Thermomonospora echinospora]SEG87961.1 hypothetical protein SAMN04489712_12145 [Thermomonospora echinospora]
MTDHDAGRVLATELGVLLEPVISAVEDPDRLRTLLHGIGWDLDALTGFPVSRITALLAAVESAHGQLAAAVAQPPDDLDGARALLPALARCFTAVRALGTAFDDWTGPRPHGFADLGRDLLELLVVRYLRERRPLPGAVLQALGLIEPRTPEELPPLVLDGASGLPVRFPAGPHRIRLDRLPRLVGAPLPALREIYLGPDGLGTRDAADAAADLIFPAVAAILHRLGLDARHGRPVDASAGADLQRSLAHMLHVRLPLPERSTDPADLTSALSMAFALAGAQDGRLGLVVIPHTAAALSRRFGAWQADLTADLDGTGVFAVGPQKIFTDSAKGQAARIQAMLSLVRQAGGEQPVLRVGGTSGTRFEVAGPVAFTALADLSADRQEYGGEFTTGGAALIVSTGDGDGFLQKMLSGRHRLDFAFGLGWSRQRGLFLSGGAALEAEYAVGAGIGGPARLDRVTLSVRPSTDPDAQAVDLIAAASGRVRLGPVAIDVRRIGLRGRLAFPPEGGNLGPADLDLAFQPPSGIALKVDAGAVTGAGFLSFDPAAARYSGGVDLDFASFRLAAMGLLTTRLPGGRPGFSLLVVINARFPQPIPLGFGFNLAAVGGLLGVNRAADVARLRAGLRNGALTALLSPGDAVGDERRLIDDLDSLFPATADRHVFGPTARLTWGVPTVVTIDLGLALELPKPLRFIAAGRIRLLLPDERAPIADLKMDALGVLDIGEGTLAMDAVLYDSQIAGWRLSGDMALRARWTGRTDFVMSAGGFHPRFRPPPGFPALRRMTMAIGGEDVRIRLQAYLALTAATLQMGSAVEVYARAGDVTATGHFTFDALVRFDPFGFEIDVALALSVRWKDKLLLGVYAELHLTGPGRWHVLGRAEIHLLFLKIRVSFEGYFGDEPPQPALPPENAADRVRAALGQRGAWQVDEPAGRPPALTMRADLPRDLLLVSPAARVTVRQAVAPVGGVRLDRLGRARLTGDREIRIEAASLGGDSCPTVDVEDPFAPDQYFDRSDEDKLTLPSFDRLPSGVSFTATDTIDYDRSGPPGIPITYTTLVVDAPDTAAASTLSPAMSSLGSAGPGRPLPGGPRRAPDWTLGGAELAVLAKTGAAAHAETRTGGLNRFDAPGLDLSVHDTAYEVVSVHTLTPAGPRPAGGERWSRTEAADRLRRWLADHPADTGRLTIVPVHEAGTAAVSRRRLRTRREGVVSS